MAPFSILAPFLRRKVKKYERLETEDPEKRRQEATMEELTRINMKIEKLVNSMTQEDFQPASCPEDECVRCRRSRAVMQVSPCSHQALCRLCFLKNIQEAVATRNLPLCCVLCQCKILRVKNNYRPAAAAVASLPKSVSGYEVAAAAAGGGSGRLRHSDSSYSVTSVSSYGSGRSTTSARSAASGTSWFSIDSLSSFQTVSFDRNLPQPRAHSLTSRRSRRPPQPAPAAAPSIHPAASSSSIPNSASSPALAVRATLPSDQPAVPKLPPTSFSVPENLSDYLQSAPISAFPPAKVVPRRPAGGKENHQILRLKLKSPDLAETSFIMSTIEEEIEGVNVSQTSQELISLTSRGGSQELIDLGPPGEPFGTAAEPTIKGPGEEGRPEAAAAAEAAARSEEQARTAAVVSLHPQLARDA